MLTQCKKFQSSGWTRNKARLNMVPTLPKPDPEMVRRHARDMCLRSFYLSVENFKAPAVVDELLGPKIVPIWYQHGVDLVPKNIQ